MKILLRKVLPAVLLAMVWGPSAFAQGRIGTIDMGKAFDNYWRTKQADAALKEQAADMEKEHRGFVDDWNKAKEEHQKLHASANEQAVSPEERDKRKSAEEKKLLEIKELEQTITQYERQARTTLEEKQRRMRANLVNEIRAVVAAQAKSAGYALVLDTAGASINNIPVVIYQNTENDLTEAVLSQLNASAPADFSKTGEKKEEEKKNEKKLDSVKSSTK